MKSRKQTPCRFLRWKGRNRRHFSGLRALLSHLAENKVPYRCLRTAQPIGPDDGPVAPELCTRERACWEAPKDAPRGND